MNILKASCYYSLYAGGGEVGMGFSLSVHTAPPAVWLGKEQLVLTRSNSWTKVSRTSKKHLPVWNFHSQKVVSFQVNYVSVSRNGIIIIDKAIYNNKYEKIKIQTYL